MLLQIEETALVFDIVEVDVLTDEIFDRQEAFERVGSTASDLTERLM